MNGKTVSLDNFIARTTLFHDLSVDVDMEGSGDKGINKKQDNNVIFNYVEDDSIVNSSGDGIIKGSSQSRLLQVDDSSLLAGESTGVGKTGDIIYKFSVDETSDSPEANGEASVRSVKLSKKYENIYYSSTI